MPVFVVTYELNKKNKDYSRLYNELKNTQAWWHYLEPTWLLYTDESAHQIFNRLIPYIDEDDSLLIVEAGHDRYGWLTKEAWEWIDGVL